MKIKNVRNVLNKISTTNLDKLIGMLKKRIQLCFFLQKQKDDKN